jgi:cobalamin synthase
MAYLPLVGIIVGCIAGLTFMGSQALSGSKALAVIASIAVSLALTGAFLERATMASIIKLLITYQSLLLIPGRSIPFVLISAHAFSRFAAGSLTVGAQTVTADEQRFLNRNNVIMASLGMLPLILVGSLLFLLLVPLLWVVRTLVGAWLCRNQGTYTSTRLLTTQNIVEVSFYLLAAVAFKFAFDISTN